MKPLDMLDKGDIVRMEQDWYRILNRNPDYYLAVNLVTCKVNYKLLIERVKNSAVYMGTQVDTIRILYGLENKTTGRDMHNGEELIRRKF